MLARANRNLWVNTREVGYAEIRGEVLFLRFLSGDELEVHPDPGETPAKVADRLGLR